MRCCKLSKEVSTMAIDPTFPGVMIIRLAMLYIPMFVHMTFY